jgi:hypothetical protein
MFIAKTKNANTKSPFPGIGTGKFCFSITEVKAYGEIVNTHTPSVTRVITQNIDLRTPSFSSGNVYARKKKSALMGTVTKRDHLIHRSDISASSGWIEIKNITIQAEIDTVRSAKIRLVALCMLLRKTMYPKNTLSTIEVSNIPNERDERDEKISI